MQLRKSVKLLIAHEHPEFCADVAGTADLLRHEIEIACKVAHTGEDAIECIKSWAPAVVLLDAHIGGTNGFEILERFRDSVSRIIITSHYRSPEIEQSALLRGAAGYVATSGTFEEIEGLLQSIAELSVESSESH